jgi:hypothetical protein
VLAQKGWTEHVGLVLDRRAWLTCFRYRLAEAVAWNHERPKELRSEELNPFGPSHLRYWLRSEEWQHWINEMSAERSRLLQRCRRVPRAVGSGENAARYVAFCPDDNLSDGAAEAVSGGYFDERNVPAWNTWLFWVEASTFAVRRVEGRSQPLGGGFLLALAPPALTGAIDAGIDVNPERCIGWAEEILCPWSEALRQEGLLR